MGADIDVCMTDTDFRILEKSIQNLTDDNIKNIEKILEEKEKEILNI